MCCSSHKATRRSQTLATRQALIGASNESTPLVTREKQPIGDVIPLDAMSIVSAPPSYRVATAKHQAGPYDLAPIPPAPREELPTLVKPEVTSESLWLADDYTPAQLACPHQFRRRRFGIGGIIGGIAFFPWGLFWTFGDSWYECKACRANLGHRGDGRRRQHGCGSQPCGRRQPSQPATMAAPHGGGCCGANQCGHCGRRQCRRSGCAGCGSMAC